MTYLWTVVKPIGIWKMKSGSIFTFVSRFTTTEKYFFIPWNQYQLSEKYSFIVPVQPLVTTSSIDLDICNLACEPFLYHISDALIEH